MHKGMPLRLDTVSVAFPVIGATRSLVLVRGNRGAAGKMYS